MDADLNVQFVFNDTFVSNMAIRNLFDLVYVTLVGNQVSRYLLWKLTQVATASVTVDWKFILLPELLEGNTGY